MNNNNSTKNKSWFFTYVIDILPLIIGFIMYVSYIFNKNYFMCFHININDYLDTYALLNSFLSAIAVLINIAPMMSLVFPFCIMKRVFVSDLAKKYSQYNNIRFSLCLAFSSSAFFIIGVIPYLLLLKFTDFEMTQYYHMWLLTVGILCFCTIDIHAKSPKVWYKPLLIFVICFFFSIALLNASIKLIGKYSALHDIIDKQKINFTLKTENEIFTNENYVYFDVLGNSTLLYNYKEDISIVVPKERIIQLEIK